MSGQNILHLPHNSRHPYWSLEIKEGRLLFYTENQGCYLWSTLPDGEDPPVFGYAEAEPWLEEGMSVTEHLILACIYEATVHHARYRADAAFDESALRRITESIPALAIAPWAWAGGIRFHAGNGAFMLLNEFERDGERKFSARIVAKTEQPLQFLREFVNPEWRVQF